MESTEDLLPDAEDVSFEEELLRTPYSVKLWCRYIDAKRDAAPKRRYLLYERALRLVPGSYKIWHAYLRERFTAVRGQNLDHPSVASLTQAYERALVTMHKMPVIWCQYLSFLTKQKFITKCRRAFDKALASLPVTQHDRIWTLYLEFVHQPGIPDETAFRIYRRYLQLEPSHAEEYIELLKSRGRWGEAARKLTEVLNDEDFHSVTGKSKHLLWLELSDIITRHPSEVQGINVDAILRGGIRKFTDEVGRLWTSLADYYIRQGMFERARDVYEEGLSDVVTVRDFGLIFDAFAAFEESLITARMEEVESSQPESSDSDGGDFLLLDAEDDIDLKIARLEDLMKRRPVLLSSVMLRQNPHNVHEWHKRVKLFKGNPTKQILTYTEAVKTVSCHKSIGKLHSLWCAFAKFYEYHGDIKNARVIFQKGTQVGMVHYIIAVSYRQAEFKYVDDLASVWCEWAEMELRHANFQKAVEVVRRATQQPFRVPMRLTREEQMKLPVKDRLYKNSKIWSLYCDLEESLGTLESTREVYDRILELRIATPQIILNYANFLQEHKYFEDSYSVYERGIALFKYPHVGDVWQAYIRHFIQRYGGKKVERVRDMFEQALQQAPESFSKSLYLHYAQFEEQYGLVKHAMSIYEKAASVVPIDQRMEVYEIYLSKAMEFFGIGKVREIYQTAIEAQPPHELSDDDCKTMFVRFAALEKNLGEIDRARAIYTQASYMADPSKDTFAPTSRQLLSFFHRKFWDEWNAFEIRHGNEDTFREMCRIKRSVTASFSQIHFNTTMVESVVPTLPGRVFYLEQSGSCPGTEEVAASPMQDLERQVEGEKRPDVLGKFVRGEVIQTSQNSFARPSNPEAMELDEEEEEDIDVTQKDVPEAVFGGLKRKAGETSKRPRKKQS